MTDTTLKLILLGEDKSASKALGAVGIGAAVAGAALLKFGGDAVQAYLTAEKQQAKLEDAFRRFPKLADTNIDALSELNAAIQRKVGADADDLAAAQATMAQYDLTGKQLERLTPLLVDYATKTGKDMPDAAGALGKALMGNARAMKDLGIDFKVTGDRGADFETLLGHLQEKVGGYAESVPDAERKSKILAATFEDLQEDIGEKLLPVVIALMETGQGLVDWASENQAVLIPLGKVAGIAAVGIAAITLAAKGVEGAKGAITTVKSLTTAIDGLSTKARVAAVGVGAVTIALTLAAAIYAQAADRQAKVTAATDDFTAALQASNGALDENVRKTAAKRLADADAFGAAEHLGIALDVLTDAAMGNAAAIQVVHDRLAEVQRQEIEARSATHQLDTALTDSEEAILTVKDALGIVSTGLDDAQTKQRQMETATKDASTATRDHTRATGDNAEATGENADAQRELADALDEATDAWLRARGDVRSLEAAYDGATEALWKGAGVTDKMIDKHGKLTAEGKKLVKAYVDSGKALDVTTDAGRRNQDALDGIVKSAGDVRDSMVNTGASAEEVDAAMAEAEKQFRKVAKQMGVSKGEADALAESIRGIKSRTVTVNAIIKVGGDKGIKTVYSAGGGVKFSAYATGGQIATEQIAIVGEQGPEAVRLPVGTSVYPATSKETRAATGGRGTTVSITVNGALDAQGVARQIRSMLIELDRDLGGRGLGLS